MLTLTNVHKEYEDFTLDCSIELMPGRSAETEQVNRQFLKWRLGWSERMAER